MTVDATNNELTDSLAAEVDVQSTLSGAGGKTKRNRTAKSQGPTYVYTITHRATGNCYVGITSQSTRIRWNAHVRSAYKQDTNQHIHRAIRLYGPEAFDWQVVSLCETREDAILAEMTWIAAGWGYYNSTKGGEGVVGVPKTEKQIEATKKAVTGNTWNLGRKHTEEVRSNMSKAAKKRGPPVEATRRARDANKGRSLPEWHRQKLLSARIGSRHTEISKEKMRAASTGVKQSPDTVAKRVAATQLTKARKKEHRILLEAMGPEISEVILDG